MVITRGHLSNARLAHQQQIVRDQNARKRFVGLDITPHAVTLVRLESGLKWPLNMVGFSKILIPEGTIVQDRVRDFDALRSAIRQAVDDTQTQGYECAFSVSGSEVFLTSATFHSVTTQRRFAMAVRLNAKATISENIRDYYLDFQVTWQTSSRRGRTDVLIVAAKQRLLSEYTSAISSAGLKPSIANATELVLADMVERFYPDCSRHHPVMIVDLQSTTLRHAVVFQGKFLSGGVCYNAPKDHTVVEMIYDKLMKSSAMLEEGGVHTMFLSGELCEDFHLHAIVSHSGMSTLDLMPLDCFVNLKQNQAHQIGNAAVAIGLAQRFEPHVRDRAHVEGGHINLLKGIRTEV